MAETTKPKRRRKSTIREPVDKSQTAAKSKESRQRTPETPAKPADRAAASDSEHVKVIPPAQAKPRGRAWLLSFLLMIVVVGVGHITWPRWQTYVMEYVPDSVNAAFADSRIGSLTTRISELEFETNSLRQRDKEIVRLEGEREKLQHTISGILERVENLESSIFAVKKMAKAAATATAQEAAAASHGLKKLNDRLKNLEPAAAPRQAADPAFVIRLDKLENSIALAEGLSQRIVKLEKSDARSRQELTVTQNQLNTSRQTFQELASRVASVEARPANTGPGKLPVIILAVSDLRDAVHQGNAYVTELEVLKAATGNGTAVRAALIRLEKHAAKGVGTLSDLREAFSKLAGTIVAADRDAADAGWIDRTLERVSSLIKFRRIDGSSEATSADFLVFQAEKHLANGNLAAAFSAIEKLDGAAKVAASKWLSRAMARLGAEQSLATLHAHATAMLSAAKG